MLILSVDPLNNRSERFILCNSDYPFNFNGKGYDAPGIYKDTLKSNNNSCDTILTLELVTEKELKAIVNQPASVCYPATVDLTSSSITYGSDTGLIISYWADSLLKNQIINPSRIDSSGTYYLKIITNQKCKTYGVFKVSVTINRAIASMRYPTMETDKNVSLQLNARKIGMAYIWNPSIGLNNSSIFNPVFNYDRSMNYTIHIKNSNGCITTDSLSVIVKWTDSSKLSGDIIVPNAWTPNRDGRNDVLRPKLINIRTLTYFRVFNRWGQLVYSTNYMNEGWDGVFNGMPQVSDMYSWTVEGIGLNGKKIAKSGNAILLR
jgi:gliding motility-associated-like protein